MFPFHELETASTRGFQPTGVVDQAFRLHSATALEAFADKPRIGVLKPLDHHVEHQLECTLRGPQTAPYGRGSV